MSKTIVIVGGVAGGMSAATRLRRLDEQAEIIVIERSGHVSFANCGLPYYVGGIIEQRGALLLQTPASLGARFGLDVRVRHEVISIDREASSVQVRDLGSGAVYSQSFDALVLSPGATPVRPPIPGIERALTLRNIEDTDALVEACRPDAQSAVVIGGGFIGIEVAENLVHRGMRVAIVEATDQVMAPIDPELAALVHDQLRNNGVELHLGAAVTEIGAGDVLLADGARLNADLVVAAIGVRPDSRLAVEAGLKVGARGGICVDDQFRTEDPRIFAIGDAVEKVDAVDDSATLVPLAQTANLQGRLVADVIMGREVYDRPVLGTAIVGVFGMQVASTGWNEKRLRAAGRAYRAIHTHPANHAGYYPGSAQLSLKLLVDPETDEILGAQGVGEAGVDKRIDVIATAMTGGLLASELAELELAYAPQFGSAKDPINMLGWIAANLRDGLTDTIQWHEIEAATAAGATLLDVRTVPENEATAIPGSVVIPLDQLRDRLDEVPSGDLLLYCGVGLRGYLASRVLEQHRDGRGWGRIRNLDGGIRTWLAGVSS